MTLEDDEKDLIDKTIVKLGSHRQFLEAYARHLEDVLKGEDNESHQRFIIKLQNKLNDLLEIFEY